MDGVRGCVGFVGVVVVVCTDAGEGRMEGRRPRREKGIVTESAMDGRGRRGLIFGV